jgi:hypothetical protein
LTSKKAHLALNDYLRSHAALRDEIEQRMGVVHGVEDDGAQAPSMDGDCYDDADIPSRMVIQHSFGLDISGTGDDAPNCVTHTKTNPENGGLTADGVYEDVWAWNMGEKWGDELPETCENK